MGAGASKQAGKAAAGAGRRQYPSSSSILNNATSTSNAPGTNIASNSSTGAASSNAVPNYTKPNAPSQVHPNPSTSPPSDTKDPHIDLDGRDPQFGSALRQLGPAVSVDRARPGSGAFPTSSQPPLGQQGQNIFPTPGQPGAKENPQLIIVQTRKRLQELFDQEVGSLGRPGFQGRTMISAKELREALIQRDGLNKDSKEIEKSMRMKSGILDELAQKGVYQNA